MIRFSRLIIAIFAIFLSQGAYAQLGVSKRAHRTFSNLTIGAKLGMNMQRTFGSNNIFKGSYSQGIMGGAFGSFYKSERFAVRVELLAKKAKLDYLPYHATIKCFYLDLPVMAEYLIGDVVWLQAGLQYTRMLSARNTGIGSGSDVRKLWFNSNDLGLVVGAEVVITPRLIGGARYVHGLFDLNGLNDPSKGVWKNSGLQITAGYRFFN